jgi:hypothetical protein
MISPPVALPMITIPLPEKPGPMVRGTRRKGEGMQDFPSGNSCKFSESSRALMEDRRSLMKDKSCTPFPDMPFFRKIGNKIQRS